MKQVNGENSHFYKETEAIIKTAIWWVAWIGGIRAIQDIEPSREALGGAFLFFSLSLLMEFVEEKKKHKFAKIVHTAFCSLCVILLLGAFGLIFCKSDFISKDILYKISLGLLVILSIDGFIVCLKDRELEVSVGINKDNDIDKGEEMRNEFLERGTKGSLGNIGGLGDE